MNAYTKMVLISQDEYYKLKSFNKDPISSNINSPLPPQMRQNLINKTLSSPHKEPPKTPNFTMDEPTYAWDDDFDDDQDETREELNVERWPPQIKQKLKDIITPRGRIINSAQKPIPGSNINRVLNFLTSSTPKRGPSGYKKVARTLASRDAADIITHPQGARYLDEVEQTIFEQEEEPERNLQDFREKLQSGSGWSSIKNF